MRRLLTALLVAGALFVGVITYNQVTERRDRVREICRSTQHQWVVDRAQTLVFTQPVPIVPTSNLLAVHARNRQLAAERAALILAAGSMPRC